MNNRIKLLILTLILVMAAALMVSCGGSKGPYDGYEDEGYTVSIKYDSNGGIFTTNTSVIVDTYSLSTLPTNDNGEKLVTLVSPDNSAVRGKENAFLPQKMGYFLAGWYTERTAVTDGAGNELDEDGNIASQSGKPVAYTYSGRWDFAKDKLAVDPASVEGADTPVVTLYAAWAPRFAYEFYDINTGKLIGTYEFDPIYINQVTVPEWNTTTGQLDMHEFPKVDNKTFSAVYLDKSGATPVTDPTIPHSGVINLENATTSGNVMSLYVDMLDGNWYNIYTADHFIKYASPTGNYNIMADLDFTGKGWKNTLTYGNFSGTINGNGHTLSNITVTQNDAGKSNAGLFGTITDSATIKDVKFENVTLNIETGSRRPDASFGLLCGSLSANATFTGFEISGNIVITPTPLITDATTIGLLCGSGSVGNIDISGITCEALEPADEYTDPISLTIEGNKVTVTVVVTEQ